MKTKCLIIDDEPLAIEVIESHLEKINDIEIAAKCENAVEAFEIIRKKNIDLIFLDIQMPELTGIDFLKSLSNPPKVILTTAYRKYALEGYELDVVDYLLKPISFERFMKAINKYYKAAGNELKVIQEEKDGEDYIYVKENKKSIKLDFAEIKYIESLKDYVTIYTETKKVITKITMTELEEKLPSNKFIRIHRSFIVSIPKIEAFTSTSIEIGKKELTIGRNYKNSVMKALKHTEWI
ncbi:LytR/AlgR family response regulator transcription factor [Bacteroidota bacterium]